MAHTGHGHQIAGTHKKKIDPAQRRRCGGPKECEDCMRDVVRHALKDVSLEMTAGEMIERLIVLLWGALGRQPTHHELVGFIRGTNAERTEILDSRTQQRRGTGSA